MTTNAFYAQSGGVTAVINATAAGVIETVRANQQQIGNVYAGRNGILGALTEDLIDTSHESAADIAALYTTPGGAFGSCRFKLGPIDTHRDQYLRLLEVFKAHNIGYFFYNGGGDSQDTSHKVAQFGAELGHRVISIGLPKTVDNDLPFTDTCPGFGSVAKYVATSILEASLDLRSMAANSTKVFILEVMGRHAGWIAAATGLAGTQPDDPPHIILFPEVAFDEERFVNKVRETVERVGFCVIAVSEGTRRADGSFLAAGEADAFGNVQLGGAAAVVANIVQQRLGFKHHWALPDYLQRSARHIASATDLEQAYALGKVGVELALAGTSGVMPIVRRLADEPYTWDIDHVPLERVANVEREVPADYIRADGFGITPACRRYLSPLIQGEAPPPYEAGLPRYITLKNIAVEKRLPRFVV